MARGDDGAVFPVVLLHLRRLDGFVRRHGLHSTAHTLERESLVFFDVAHLQKLVRTGRWDAAWRYVHRFSPLFSEGGEGPRHRYTAFIRTLEHHAMLHYLACRGDEGGRAAKSLYSWAPDDAFRHKFPEMAKQHDLYRTMASPQARLRGPRRYHQKKRIVRKPAHELAYFLLQKRAFFSVHQFSAFAHFSSVIKLSLNVYFFMSRISSVETINHSGDSVSTEECGDSYTCMGKQGIMPLNKNGRYWTWKACKQ